MSFASDMGHDIPNGYETGCYSSNYNYSGKLPYFLDIKEIKNQTEKAWLVVFEETETEHWIPKSIGKLMKNDKIIRIPEWLVEKLAKEHFENNIK